MIPVSVCISLIFASKEKYLSKIIYYFKFSAVSFYTFITFAKQNFTFQNSRKMYSTYILIDIEKFKMATKSRKSMPPPDKP